MMMMLLVNVHYVRCNVLWTLNAS